MQRLQCSLLRKQRKSVLGLAAREDLRKPFSMISVFLFWNDVFHYTGVVFIDRNFTISNT